MPGIKTKKKILLGEEVLYTPKDASREPAKGNAGKIGRVVESITQEGKIFYLLRFGKGVWDEVCASEEEVKVAG